MVAVLQSMGLIERTASKQTNKRIKWGSYQERFSISSLWIHMCIFTCVGTLSHLCFRIHEHTPYLYTCVRRRKRKRQFKLNSMWMGESFKYSSPENSKWRLQGQIHGISLFCFGTGDRTENSVNAKTHTLPLSSFLVPASSIQIVR